MSKKTQTPVMQLMAMVYANACRATGLSWERINQSMRRALLLAIESGFLFTEDDFANVFRMPNAGYWTGEMEEYYSAAVAGGNTPACHSFEAMQRRPPYIMDDVRHDRDGGQHGTPSRERDRVAVGSRTTWNGYSVQVTSFAKDGSYLTACSYKPRDPKKKFEYETKIDRRFKITREAIHEARAEAKERAELLAKLTDKANGDEKLAVKITKALGCKKRDQFDDLPLPTIRSVVEKFCA